MPPKRGASERATSNAKRVRTNSTAPAVKPAPKKSSSPPLKKAPVPKKAAAKKAITTKQAPAATKAAVKAPTKTKSAEPKTASKKRKASDELPDAKRAKTTSSTKSTSPRPRAVPKSRVAKVLPILTHAPTNRLTVFVCGEASGGELGLGPHTTAVKRPRLNALLDPETVGVVQAFAGGMHGIALTHDNKILTWGVNDECALGRITPKVADEPQEAAASDSDSEDEPQVSMNPYETTPTAIPSKDFPADTVFTQVGAGDSASFVLTNTGLVYGWGTFRDSNGVFGFSLDKDHKIIKRQLHPMQVPGLKDIVKISVGLDYALALDKKGDVWAWGTGQQDQLGRRLIDRRREDALLPHRVPLPHSKKVVSIHAGSNHAFAVDKAGNTWAWGLNNFCQTGIDAGAGEDAGSITAPTIVKSLAEYKMKVIAGGNHHTVACTEDGKTLVWGRVDAGQLGLDMAEVPEEFVRRDTREKPRILTRPTPLSISSAHVTASSEHCIAITPEGKAYSWGFNATYVCGQGEEDEIKVPTMVDNTAVREKALVWAGTGGQFTIFASKFEEQPLTNGVNGH